jgi:hypothetical protein
VDNGKAVE